MPSETPIILIGLKVGKPTAKVQIFPTNFDKIEALGNVTTLLSANKSIGFTKMNTNSAIKRKFTKFLLVYPASARCRGETGGEGREISRRFALKRR
ncbi:MAG: hypothetical protein A2167_07560 [Planctomycetes bacterium RBG_13_46_10]|nr:MAG: hypothetical protein A2167_07560 [Planctomycetes bacterium RBG_13_46_10]